MRRVPEIFEVNSGAIRFSTAIVSVVALGLSGCAASTQLQSDTRDLRRMVVETREELEEVRRDQERLRSLVEYMQYADGTGGQQGQAYPTAAAPTGDPRWKDNPAWSYQGQGDDYAASQGGAYPDSAAPMPGGADGRQMASAPPTGFPGSGGYPGTPDGMNAAVAPGAPVGSEAPLTACLSLTPHSHLTDISLTSQLIHSLHVCL